jgi:type VI protein secretion system component Hcp
MDSSKFQELYEELMQQIEEALGVPKNITDESQRIYKEFVKLLSKANGSKTTYQTIINNFNAEIGTNFYQDLTIKVFFEVVPNLNKPELKKFIAPLFTSFDLDNKSLKNLTDSKNLLIELYVGVSSSSQQLLTKDMFIQQKELMVSSIAHELHHAFSFSKQKNLSTKQMIDYKIVTQMDVPIPIIQQFLDNLYFVSAYEGLVAPSEVASIIQQRKIKKSEFVKFLDQDDIYKRLKQIENLEQSKFFNALKENIKQIDAFLKSEGVTENLTEEQKINKTLEIVLTHMIRNYHEQLNTYIKTALENALVLFSDEEKPKHDYQQLVKYVQKVVAESQKFKGREIDYFLAKIKEMKEKAKDIKKRLAKLYDLCLEEAIRVDI